MVEKTAVILSAGGTRGALEAGALAALLDTGITPQLLVGSSVGALNAAALALDPTPEGADRIINEWIRAGECHIFTGNYLVML